MTTIHLGYSAPAPDTPRTSPEVLPTAVAPPSTTEEPLSIDELIGTSLGLCAGLPRSCDPYVKQIRELQSRLAKGRLQVAVLGQYNRGKSTFINALTGLRVLPTSILPVTSVPTVISWAPTVCCTVHFFNGKPDLVVRESLERVSSTLVHYVAEQNNPRNHLCVGHVDVTAPAKLLDHGTVLIDTPGFGSTYVHNTKTTLDLLAGCDAAIFLLGADPPSQTEVEFLKQISSIIPRIFLVLNKVDLLTDTEVRSVDGFVRSVLASQLAPAFTDSQPLFHTSAALAEKALQQTTDDPHWVRSGLDAVQREVLDFLVRDKYFALSEALSGKLARALRAIAAELGRELHETKAPVELLDKEYRQSMHQMELIHGEGDRVRPALDKLKRDLGTFVKEQLERDAAAIKQEVTDAVEQLLHATNASTGAWRGARPVISRILADVLGRRAALIRERLITHVLQVRTRLFSHLQKVCRSHGIERDSPDHHSPIQNTGSWEPHVREPETEPALSLAERLRGRGARVALLRARIEPELASVVEENLVSLTTSLEALIDAHGTSVSADFDRALSEITSSLQIVADRKERTLRELQATRGTRATELQERAAKFSGLAEKIAG